MVYGYIACSLIEFEHTYEPIANSYNLTTWIF